jgi:release factor glutamine methyltransferase
MMTTEPEIVTRLRAAGCVFAEDEARILLEAASGDELERLIEQRVHGVPLEHLVGWVEFAGLRLAVATGVFVPRKRTESLARAAVDASWPGATVVELCCGAAPIATTVRAAEPRAIVYAADIDPVATTVAERNLGGGVFTGDLFDALPRELRGGIDVLVANAPYVPTEAIALMPPEARDFEPAVALDGGDDGLDVHRRIFHGAWSWLSTSGILLVESSEEQCDDDIALLVDSGFAALATTDEATGGTVVTARPQALTIAAETSLDADVTALLVAGEQFGAALYGPASYYGLSQAALFGPDVTFLVARIGFRAVGTIAFLDRGDGSAELKRMYVDPDFRGRRVATRLLEEAERLAREAGVTLMQLETGPKQPDAISLYEEHGYAQVPLFPPYEDEESSYCMEKLLA